MGYNDDDDDRAWIAMVQDIDNDDLVDEYDVPEPEQSEISSHWGQTPVFLVRTFREHCQEMHNLLRTS